MKLCSETTRLWLGFHLSFEHFDIISMMENCFRFVTGYFELFLGCNVEPNLKASPPELLNPLNTSIKIEILIYRPCTFSTELVGRIC